MRQENRNAYVRYKARKALSALISTVAILGIHPTKADAQSSVASQAHAQASLPHFKECDVCSEMVVLPSGKYMMGANKDEFRGLNEKYQFMYTDETPRHEEHVTSFAIAKFDVTREQFSVFARETGFQGKGCEIFDGKDWHVDSNADWKNPGFKQTNSDPVVCVSWNDTQKYIAWLNSKLNKKDGRKYRLPTEAEWEYAARAGTTTAMYWGNDIADQCKYENTRDQSARLIDPSADLSPCTDGYVYTAPVGSFRPNPWGLFDMLGNAGQWVQDCVRVEYYGPPDISPNPDACKGRTLRGASWASIPAAVRAAARGGQNRDARESAYGFRVARNVLPN